MTRQFAQHPIVSIEERNGRIFAIRVRHAGRLPPLPARFTPDVVQRAMSLSRSRFEHKVLRAARRLGRVGYRVVERSLILQRCEQVAQKLEARGSFGRKNPAPLMTAKRDAENKNSPTLTEAWSRKFGLAPVAPQQRQDPGRGR